MCTPYEFFHVFWSYTKALREEQTEQIEVTIHLKSCVPECSFEALMDVTSKITSVTIKIFLNYKF